MPAFTTVVAQKCGNIHEMSSCSETCARAMQAHAADFGCCWEDVMQAYAQIDRPAELAWRSWQGALAGKCDITFADKGCGDSMGESVYQQLRSEVDALKKQQSESRQVIRDLVAQTQGTAAQDLCLVDKTWVPCKDASFFRDSRGKTKPDRPKALPSRPLHALSEVRRKHTLHVRAAANSSKSEAGAAGGGKAGKGKPAAGASTKKTARKSHAQGKVLEPPVKASGVGKSMPSKAEAQGGQAKDVLSFTGGARKQSSNGAAEHLRPPKQAIDVEPDYGLVVSKHATRKESAAEKARQEHSTPAFLPKGLWNAIKPLWPWQKGAFKSVASTPHLKAHRRNANLLGDRAVKLKHSMQVVNSPLPSTTDEPLWGRLEKMATDGIAEAPPKARHGQLWGRSHRWGPSDNDIALPRRVSRHGKTHGRLSSFGPHRPLVHLAGRGEERGKRGATKKVWVSRNSPWAPDAGFLDPHDPAAKRLSAAGIVVDSDMGVI
jgi:hypothetical protein